MLSHIARPAARDAKAFWISGSAPQTGRRLGRCEAKAHGERKGGGNANRCHGYDEGFRRFCLGASHSLTHPKHRSSC